MSDTTYTGSDLVALRSAQAISKLMRELGTLGQLKAAFGTSKASIESCSATATIVMEKISDNDFVGGKMSVLGKSSIFSKATSMPMTTEAIVTEIMGMLEGPNAVYVNVANDHHFVVLPMDDDRIAMIQAFQGSYHLVDWFAWRGVGMMMRSEFAKALSDFLTSGSRETWVSGAKKLFSFDLAKQTPGGTTRSKAQVAEDIADWFGARPYVKGYGYKPL